MGGAPIEALPVVAQQDRPAGALADGQVEGAGGAGHDGHHGRLVALADDPQRPVTTLDGEVFDVGGAGFAHPQSVEAEQHGQGSVGGVHLLGREQERAQLAPIEAAGLGRMDLGTADVLRRVGPDASVDVGEAIEAADRREPPVDGGGGQAPFLQGADVELDLRAGGAQDGEPDLGGPLEKDPQVVSIRVERPAVVAGQECGRRELRLVEAGVAGGQCQLVGGGVECRHSASFIGKHQTQVDAASSRPPANRPLQAGHVVPRPAVGGTPVAGY